MIFLSLTFSGGCLFSESESKSLEISASLEGVAKRMRGERIVTRKGARVERGEGKKL